MRGQWTLGWTLRSRPHPRARLEGSFVCLQCRAIQISASPTTPSSRVAADAFGAPSQGVTGVLDTADATFEVLGSPHSLLSVTLSASQKLYTRRGTLVSIAGQVENAQSTLSILSPFRRALLGVPFLYQRISSTTPITALIATKSPSTTFSVLHLDGTTDWMVAQRNALLAWTGHTLRPAPRIQRSLSLTHWGATHLTGRGLAALASPGTIYEVTLAEGEELVLHPSHVAAYSVGRTPPLPFRLRSAGALKLQVPALPASVTALASRAVPERLARFWDVMRHTETYKFIARFLFSLRTAARRSLWGDRLFLQFRGPTTILMSSRGVRVADVLSADDINEIADTGAGVVPDALDNARTPQSDKLKPVTIRQVKPVSVHIASVGGDGKVRFEDSKDLKDFLQ